MKRDHIAKKMVERRIPNQLQKILNRFSQTLDDCVDYGGNIYTMLDKSERITEKDAPIILMFMHFLDTLDSISILTRKGATSGVRTLLRTLFETSLSLKYMIQEPREKGVIAYSVAYAFREIKARQLVDPNLPKGKEFIEKVQKSFGPQSVFPQADINESTKHLKNFLELDWVKEVATEYKRIKKENKGKEPNWYSLYGGPRNLRELARYFDMEPVYETLYFQLSKHQHASGVFSLMKVVDGKAIVPGIRNVDGLQQELKWVLNIVRFTYKHLFQTVFPSELISHAKWEVEVLSKKAEYIYGPEKIKVEYVTK